MLFFKLFQKDDEIIDDFCSLITRFYSIDNTLKKILVFLARSDWLDSSSNQTVLEETCIDAAASSEDTTFFRCVLRKNVFVDLIRGDLYHANKRNLAAALQNTILESMCGITSTDNKIAISSD